MVIVYRMGPTDKLCELREFCGPVQTVEFKSERQKFLVIFSPSR
jgi:hypothetical protein